MTYDEFLDLCYTIPVTTRDDLMKAFRTIDKDGDGFISTEEFLELMSTGEEAVAKKDLLSAIRKADVDREGKLNYTEFANSMSSSLDKLLNVTREAFDKTGKADSKGGSGLSVVNQALNAAHPSKRDIQIPKMEFFLKKQLDFKQAGQNFIAPDDWSCLRLRGCFIQPHLAELGEIQFPSFDLTLKVDMEVDITMRINEQLLQRAPETQAAIIFLIMNQNNLLVSHWDRQRGSHLLTTLTSGTYRIVPVLSGTYFTRPLFEEEKSKPQLVKKDEAGGLHLTTFARDALSLLFKLYDFDMNGLWSEDEYSRFSQHARRDERPSLSWFSVQDYCNLENKQLPPGELNELLLREIREDDGRTDALWTIFGNSGFDNQLNLTWNLPFVVQVGCISSRLEAVSLRPTKFGSYRGIGLQNDLNKLIFCKGESLLRKEGSKPPPEGEVCRISFLNSANCVLLAMEKLRNLVNPSKLVYNINLGDLEFVPMMNYLSDPKAHIKLEKNGQDYTMPLNQCDQTLLLFGFLPQAKDSLTCEICAGIM
ncbi:unnamed protein product [Calicophoron daubneyi]